MKYALVGYLIAIHLLLIIVLMKTDFLERLQVKLRLKTIPLEELTDHYRTMVTFHSRSDGNVPEKAIIFLGDSAIQGLCADAVNPLAINYGIGNDTTAGLLKRMPMYRSISNASVIVLFIGFNDMRFRGDDEIIENYKNILELIPNNVKVIANSLLVPGEEYKYSVENEKDRIENINLKIGELSEEYMNVHYLDIGKLLSDRNGNLKRSNHVGDGLHLNNTGNEVWINALKSMIN